MASDPSSAPSRTPSTTSLIPPPSQTSPGATPKTPASTSISDFSRPDRTAAPSATDSQADGRTRTVATARRFPKGLSLLQEKAATFDRGTAGPSGKEPPPARSLRSPATVFNHRRNDQPVETPGNAPAQKPKARPSPPRTPPHSPNRPNRQITPLTPAWNTTACAHLHFLLAHRRPFLPAKRPEIPMQPAINRQMQPPSQNSRAIPSLTNKSGLPRLDNPLIPPPNQLTVTGICRNTIGA